MYLGKSSFSNYVISDDQSIVSKLNVDKG